jgi:hypothetical protein
MHNIGGGGVGFRPPGISGGNAHTIGCVTHVSGPHFLVPSNGRGFKSL